MLLLRACHLNQHKWKPDLKADGLCAKINSSQRQNPHGNEVSLYHPDYINKKEAAVKQWPVKAAHTGPVQTWYVLTSVLRNANTSGQYRCECPRDALTLQVISYHSDHIQRCSGSYLTRFFKQEDCLLNWCPSLKHVLPSLPFLVHVLLICYGVS